MKKLAGSFLLILFFTGLLASEDSDRRLTVINSGFYRNVVRTPVILRDRFFDKQINTIIQGRGEVTKVYPVARYRKKYMVELLDRDAEKFGLKLYYFIFTSNEDWKKILVPGEVFDFKGQCMVVTSLNTSRNSYVIDIVLEHGALLVQ